MCICDVTLRAVLGVSVSDKGYVVFYVQDFFFFYWSGMRVAWLCVVKTAFTPTG